MIEDIDIDIEKESQRAHNLRETIAILRYTAAAVLVICGSFIACEAIDPGHGDREAWCASQCSAHKEIKHD